MVVRSYPRFLTWLNAVHHTDAVLFGQLSALVAALQTYGRELGDPHSHPVMTSRYDLHALRRTPLFSPDPPVIRMLYAFVGDTSTEPITEAAVLLVGGDKTTLGNLWYPPNTSLAEQRLEDYARHRPETILVPNPQKGV